MASPTVSHPIEAGNSGGATKSPTPWYLWPNLLCLDAPVIAVLWFFLLAKCHRLYLEPSVPWVLGFAVWCIYVADRWLDVLREEQLTPRHDFQRSRGGLLLRLAAVVGGLVGLWLSVSEMPQALFFTGLFLVALVGFYFLLIQIPFRRDPLLGVCGVCGGLAVGMLLSGNFTVEGFRGIAGFLPFIVIPLLVAALPLTRLGLKEMAAGLLFAMGTFLPAYFHHRLGIAMLVSPVTFLFAGLCMLNCVAVGIREEGGTLARGSTLLDPLLLALLAAASCWVAWSLGRPEARLNLVPEIPVALCIGASAALLLFLHLAAGMISKNAHRVLVDAALLTPLAALPFLG